MKKMKKMIQFKHCHAEIVNFEISISKNTSINYSTCHGPGSSLCVGGSHVNTDNVHWPCLTLAQCSNDNTIGLSSAKPGGPQTTTGLKIVCVSVHQNQQFGN